MDDRRTRSVHAAVSVAATWQVDHFLLPQVFQSVRREVRSLSEALLLLVCLRELREDGEVAAQHVVRVLA